MTSSSAGAAAASAARGVCDRERQPRLVAHRVVEHRAEDPREGVAPRRRLQGRAPDVAERRAGDAVQPRDRLAERALDVDGLPARGSGVAGQPRHDEPVAVDELARRVDVDRAPARESRTPRARRQSSASACTSPSSYASSGVPGSGHDLEDDVVGRVADRELAVAELDERRARRSPASRRSARACSRASGCFVALCTSAATRERLVPDADVAVQRVALHRRSCPSDRIRWTNSSVVARYVVPAARDDVLLDHHRAEVVGAELRARPGRSSSPASPTTSRCAATLSR